MLDRKIAAEKRRTCRTGVESFTQMAVAKHQWHRRAFRCGGGFQSRQRHGRYSGCCYREPRFCAGTQTPAAVRDRDAERHVVQPLAVAECHHHNSNKSKSNSLRERYSIVSSFCYSKICSKTSSNKCTATAREQQSKSFRAEKTDTEQRTATAQKQPSKSFIAERAEQWTAAARERSSKIF